MLKQDLAITGFDYAVNKFHDPVYDGVVAAPRRIKQAPQGIKNIPRRVRSVPRVVRQKVPGLHDHQYQREEEDMSGYERSGRGVDNEIYEPGYDGRTTARDGYARDKYSDEYEERGGRRSYDDYDSYDRRNRSSGDVGQRSRSRGDRALDKVKEKYPKGGMALEKARDKFPTEKFEKAQRGVKEKFNDHDDDGEGNDAMKKWGATLVGAAVGGAIGHKAKNHENGNWVPTAIGVVVGSIVAREGEKYYYRHQERSENDDRESRHRKRRSYSR